MALMVKNMSKKMGRLFFVLLLGLGASLLQVKELQAKEKLLVVTSFSILQDMTQQLVGDRAEVVTLVGVNEDSHTYQPKPSDSRKLAKADLVIENGLEFEGWMNRLVAASEYKGLRVIAAQGVAAISMLGEDDHDHDHSAENEHQHGEYDPHAWQSLVAAQQYVRNIRDGLIQVDPQGQAYYEAQATAYIQRLQALHKSMKSRFDRLPVSQRKVMTPHAAFGYLASAYGLTFVSPQGVSTTSEPSASEMAHLVEQIREQRVAAIFMENTGDPRLVEQLKRETKAKLGGTLYSDALSEASGPAASYLEMMQHNLETLLITLE